MARLILALVALVVLWSYMAMAKVFAGAEPPAWYLAIVLALAGLVAGWTADLIIR